MTLFFKIFAAIAAFLIVIVGGVALYLFTIFDANNYKTEIQTLAKHQTGLELDIQGDLELSVFPWLGISVEDLSIRTPNEPLASASYARVFAKFGPLLKGKLEVDGIALRDLKLDLIKNTKGHGNWDMTPATGKRHKDRKTPSRTNPATLPLAAFALGYLKIENADIRYLDQASGNFHTVEKLNFQVSNVSSRGSFPVRADFRYSNHQIKKPLQAHLTGNLYLDLDQQQVRVSDAILDLDDARLHADIEIDQLQESPVLKGRLKIAQLIPANWAVLLDQESLADIRSRLDLQTDLLLNTGTGDLTLNNFSARSPHLQLTGNINATQLNSSPNYKGKLIVNEAELRVLLPELGIELPAASDKQTPGNLTGQLDFQGDEKQLKLSAIALQLDQSKLQGELSLTSFAKKTSRFNLSIDSLDLDRYLPAAANKNNAVSAGKPQQPSANALLLPLAALRELDTSGRLRIGKLVASTRQIDNLDVNIAAHNGLINLKSLAANLYGGALQANASIDARSNTPQISLNNTLTGMQAAPLLKSLADIDYLQGKLNLQITASAYGNDIDRIKRSLNGTVEFSVLDGILKNTNLEQLVCQGVARIRDRQFITDTKNPDTVFQSFNGHINIVKGVMQTERLLLALKTLQITGNGIIDLPKETLDYRIRAKVQGDLENQACEVHERYRDIAWPLRCQGALSDDPSRMCGLDQRELKNLAARLMQQEIKGKTSGKLDEKLKEKLGEDTTQQLKDLFGL